MRSFICDSTTRTAGCYQHSAGDRTKVAYSRLLNSGFDLAQGSLYDESQNITLPRVARTPLEIEVVLPLTSSGWVDQNLTL